MRFLLALLRPFWLRLFKLYAIRGNVIADKNRHLGIGSRIAAPTRLVIGNDVYIGKLCTIECDGEIGDEGGNRECGRHHRPSPPRLRRSRPGAVVTKDVRPYAIVAGNPAREIGARFLPEIAARHAELIALGRKALSDTPKEEVRRPAHSSARMRCGAALLLLTAAVGVTVFDIRSNARTATSAPIKAGISEATLASNDTATIEDAMKHASPGATVIIQPGIYRISDLAVTPNTTLYAPQGATIVGDMVARGPKTVIRGFTFAAGTIDISNSQSVSIGDCVFDGGATAIKLDGASDALVINNDFRNVTGGVITGWGLDQSTISGNHFFDCGQCINLHFKNDPTRGRNIVIERNVFIGTARMPVEVGPLEAYTKNLVVRDNWAADFKNRGPDPGETMSTFVAYSIVPTHGVNTVITGNYAMAGARGRGKIGIELDGSGEIAGNYIQDFDYGAIVYGAGFNVHDNTFVNTTKAAVLDYAKRPGRIADNGAGQWMPRIARPPERRVWPP